MSHFPDLILRSMTTMDFTGVSAIVAEGGKRCFFFKGESFLKYVALFYSLNVIGV